MTEHPEADPNAPGLSEEERKARQPSNVDPDPAETVTSPGAEVAEPAPEPESEPESEPT